MKNTGQQKKILYLVTQGNMGGAQKYVFDMARNLRDDYEVSVACGGKNTELENDLGKEQIPFFRIPGLIRNINPLSEFKAFFQIHSLIRKIRPDIVHLNSSKAGVLGSIAAKLAGVKKVIFTVHGLVLNEPMNSMKKILTVSSTKFSMLFTDEVIAVSKRDFTSCLDWRLKTSNHLHYIPNGLDIDNFNPVSREQARLSLGKALNVNLKDKTIIGTIADFYATKGLNSLVEAAKTLIQDNSRLIFILHGRDGEQESSLTNFVKQYQLQNNIFLVKNYQRSEEVIKSFDIFALPSIKEGLPYTILEAAAAGLPIVATTVGGIPDVLENNHSAILVPPGSSKLLENALQKLLGDDKLKTILSQNANQAVQKFKLHDMVIATVEVYKKPL